MNVQEAIAHFGTRYAIAKALDVRPPSVYRWKVVPKLRQFQLAVLSRGALEVDAALADPAAPKKTRAKRPKQAPAAAKAAPMPEPAPEPPAERQRPANLSAIVGYLQRGGR